MGVGGRRAATGGGHSGGMDSRLGASTTCLRRNDGGGWGGVGSRLGGGCAFRRDGFLPPQE